MESKNDRKNRFAKIWHDSRILSGKTQEQVAKALNITVKTVRSWERGETSPDIEQAFEWFEAIGINPIRYFLDYKYPEYFNIFPDSDDQKIEAALLKYIETCTAKEKRALLYIIYGPHGSSCYAFLQLTLAYLHSSMRSRVINATTVINNYKLDIAAGIDVCKSNIPPDMAALENAFFSGFDAVCSGKKEYSIAKDQKHGEIKKTSRRSLSAKTYTIRRIRKGDLRQNNS